MSSGLATREPRDLTLSPEAPAVTLDELDLIKRTVANGATADELKLYLFDCARQGVHPLDKLVHYTKRGGKYTPVTSIDFMRIRAAETGEMAGSDDPVFQGGENPPDAATVTVYRLTQGQRFAYTATARWSEYKPDQDFMWKKMPRTMLAKCAEALALRKGFPRQLAGLYAREEMEQANSPRNGAVGDSARGALSTAVQRLPAPGDEAIDASLGASEPNAADSATSDTTPQIERALPTGAVLVRQVEDGSGKAKGFLHTHRVGESFAIYDPRLLVRVRELDGKFAFLNLKTAESGKTYLIGIESAEAPSESF